jgi:hypothetical protein
MVAEDHRPRIGYTIGEPSKVARSPVIRPAFSRSPVVLRAARNLRFALDAIAERLLTLGQPTQHTRRRAAVDLA